MEKGSGVSDGCYSTEKHLLTNSMQMNHIHKCVLLLHKHNLLTKLSVKTKREKIRCKQCDMKESLRLKKG